MNKNLRAAFYRDDTNLERRDTSLRLNEQVEPRPLPAGAIARAGVVGSSAFVGLGWHAVTQHRGWDLTSTLARDALDAIALGLTFATGERKDGLIANGGGVAANLAAILIKRLRPEERPDRSDRKSMPSEHSARAFAIAAALAKRHGWQLGLPALLDATFVGYGRVKAQKNHWYDVAAGAVLGTAIAVVADRLVRGSASKKTVS